MMLSETVQQVPTVSHSSNSSIVDRDWQYLGLFAVILCYLHIMHAWSPYEPLRVLSAYTVCLVARTCMLKLAA